MSQETEIDANGTEASSQEGPKERTDGFFCVLAYGVLLFGICFSIYLLNVGRNLAQDIKGPVIVIYHFDTVVLALLSAFMGYRRTDKPSGATLILLSLGVMYLVLLLPSRLISVFRM